MVTLAQHSAAARREFAVPPTTKGCTIRCRRSATALAAVLVALFAGSLVLPSTEAQAMNMPAWAEDFSSAGDAFEGGGGGGGGIAGSLTRTPWSGAYTASVNGEYRWVYWQDYFAPGGGIIKRCGLRPGFDPEHESIPCP